MRRISGIVLLLFAALAARATESDSFRLSMSNIKATLASMKGLTDLLASDPALHSRFKAEKKKLTDTNGRDTFSLTAARLEVSEPRIAGVYRRAGITPKQAGMTLETLLGVMMGDAMLEAAKTREANLPEGFVAENMAFYKENKTEIMLALEELKKTGTAFRDDDEDEDGQESEDESEPEGDDGKP